MADDRSKPPWPGAIWDEAANGWSRPGRTSQVQEAFERQRAEREDEEKSE